MLTTKMKIWWSWTCSRDEKNRSATDFQYLLVDTSFLRWLNNMEKTCFLYINLAFWYVNQYLIALFSYKHPCNLPLIWKHLSVQQVSKYMRSLIKLHILWSRGITRTYFPSISYYLSTPFHTTRKISILCRKTGKFSIPFS